MSLISFIYITSTLELWRIWFRPWRRVLPLKIELVRLTVENKNTHIFLVLSLYKRTKSFVFLPLFFSFPRLKSLGRGEGPWSLVEAHAPASSSRATKTNTQRGRGPQFPAPSLLPMRALHLGRRKWRPQLKPYTTLNLLPRWWWLPS